MRTTFRAPRIRSAAAIAAFLGACGDPPSASHDGGTATDDASVTEADARPADGGLPDLQIDGERSRADLALRTATFGEDACELEPDEACIDAAGERTLLHFSVATPNLGDGDLFVGSPSSQNPLFVWSECHGHYHFEDYADYQLLDADGQEVVSGHKQAFCLVDARRVVDEPDVSTQARYRCDYQGIQRGWSDVYHSRLPCQLIDVTDVEPGLYTLRLSVNSGGTLPETDRDNNTFEMEIDLTDDDLQTPTEACPDDLPATALTKNRECGWTLLETFECEPGTEIRVGCAAFCALGSCTGNPMLRLCDPAGGAGSCSYPGAIAHSEDECLSSCPHVAAAQCPNSGQVAAYGAPESIGSTWTCEPAIANSP